MNTAHSRADKAPKQKTYGSIPAVVSNWTISFRPIGSTAPGEQASPSAFSGSEADVKAHCAELTVASQQPGQGPAREYLYEPA